jgi:type I restriction enzyme S subunit
MFSVKVSSDDMKDRLDANFYRPEYLEIEHKLEQLGSTSLGSLCDGVECGPFGGNAIADDLYAEQGVAFIRPVNISSHVFDESSLVKVPEQLLIDNKLKIYKGTNLYFGRVGDPCVAVIDRKTSISPNIIVAKANSELADPHYLWAFSACTFGLKQLLRQLKTVAQPTTSTEAVRNLSVFNASLEAQKYIGDKVRQAEQLRAWAKRLEAQFKGKLATSYPEAFENKRTGKKYSKAPVDDISYTLNPGAFDEERLRIRLYLKNLGADKLRKIATIEGPTSSSYLPDTKYIGLDAISSNSCALSPSTVGESEVTGTSRLLFEGPVVAKLRPYLNKISYIPNWLSGAVGSTELLCVKATGVTSNWYLYGVLKSDIALQQLKPVASGSTHPRIDQYDLYDVVVPVHQDHELMGSWLEAAQCAYFLASQLVQTSKNLVEALIEGQLTEQQLIQAQQALDDGDNSLDQAILSKLSNEGYAIEGATPLFSDLDELYRLLESAAQAEAEE